MYIEPTRLTLALQRRQMTKKSLATQIGITPRALRLIEQGETLPKEATVKRLAAALDFPVEFFEGEGLDTVPIDAVSFRSKARMKAAQRDSAIGSATVGVSVCLWILDRFRLPDVDVPHLRETDPESAAMLVRKQWGIANKPIKHVLNLIEAKGVRVFCLDEQSLEVDALSFWQCNQPFTFLNMLKSAERTRFDACHELGHLVLHRKVDNKGKEAEQEADAFASALLMPLADLLKHVPKNPTLATLIKLKVRWGVSVMALIYRLHKVGLLSAWQHRNLIIDASKKGYRTCEPSPMKREESQMLRKVLAGMRAQGLGLEQMSKDLVIPEPELRSIISKLTLIPINGERKGSGISTFKPKVIQGGIKSA